MKTFKEFTDQLRRQIWPSGEAKSLTTSHTVMFMAAMTDLQKNVPCLQRYNTSTFKACARYWEDAATVVDTPNGYIQRVFTIANDEWRDKVFIWPDNYHGLQRWQKRLFNAATPANIGLPTLRQGFRFDDGSLDGTSGRARIGIWAIYRQRLYVAPWLKSNETLVVEWDGIKYEWLDNEAVDSSWWTGDVQEAVKLYVRWQHELHYGDKTESKLYKQEYEESRGDAMRECQRKTRERQLKDIHETQHFLTADMVADDAPPEPAVPAPIEDAFIGDWGAVTTATRDVVDLIESRNPTNVFTLGDNIYGVSGTPEPDEIWGRYWSRRIFPYEGRFEPGTEHSIWASWGNHDWDYGVPKQIAFLPGLNGNKRYYSVLHGPVHYFILSSDARDPDLGYVNSSTSAQNGIMGEWLRVSLALSTAQWKVVIFHHAVKTSDPNHTPGAAWMNWPFATWGAHMVLNGHAHNYEDFVVSGIPYIVNGLGGHSIRPFMLKVAGSEFQYDDNYGAGFLTADCNLLTHRFYSRNGTLIRTVSIDTQKNIEMTTGDVDGGGDGGDGGETDELGMTDREIIQEAASMGFQRLAPNVDVDGVVLDSPVLWSDGSSGIYTLLVKNPSFLTADSWKVTHDRRGKVITQPTVTRNPLGSVILNPALVLADL